MAEGVRIRPRAGLGIPDNAMIVVVDHARPHPAPRDGTRIEDVLPLCTMCGVQHFAKTYHVQLAAGSAIVSTTIWGRFQMLRTPSGDMDNPFEMVNPVAHPPIQRLLMPTASVSARPGTT